MVTLTGKFWNSVVVRSETLNWQTGLGTAADMGRKPVVRPVATILFAEPLAALFGQPDSATMIHIE